ncbi:MAG: NifU family protein [Acidimicrobiales bacterium]
MLTITDEALETVLEIRAEEDDAEGLALWLEISGISGTEYSYDLYFAPASDATPKDVTLERGRLTVVVPEDSLARLGGSTLDVRDGGLVLVNPNQPPARPGATAVPEGDISSPAAQAVMRILEEEINPAIASHGGVAQLVAVDEGIAYLRLGGGCQGCGMAAVTLGQGIKVAILEGVPEITDVVDVTDHAAGAKPYFESAKK